jgi:hypothetical protein
MRVKRMSSDDDSPDGLAISREAETPRGGFMARPGLKVPPRHAVVVRVGDAPQSEDIPVARPSVPPPPPPSEPPAVSSSQKITVRAIPTPSTPPPPVAVRESIPGKAIQRESIPGKAIQRESIPGERPVGGRPVRDPREQATIPSSLPGELARLREGELAPSSAVPLSDAPLVSNLDDSEAPSSRRASSSRWTIVAAAAAGLVLGLASVATRMHWRQATAPVDAASPPVVAAAEAPAAPQADARIAEQVAQPEALPAPSASAQPSSAAMVPNGAPVERLPSVPRPVSSAKRSIF